MTDAEKVKVLQDTLSWVISDVRDWCEAVSEDASWDGWDHHYKGFFYDRRDYGIAGGRSISGLSQAEAALESTRG